MGATVNPPSCERQSREFITSTSRKKLATESRETATRCPTLQRLVPALLALATLGVGVWIAGDTVRAVIDSHYPIPYRDQWSQVPVIDAVLSGAPVSRVARLLWRPHNEHRMPLAHLLALADARLVDGTQVLAMAMKLLLLLTVAILLVHTSRRERTLDVWRITTLLGIGLATSFSAVQWANLHHGFLGDFVLPTTTGSLAIVLLVLALSPATTDDSPRLRLLRLGGSLAAAATASLSLASGIAIWPALALAAHSLRLGRKVISFLVAAFVACVLLYLLGDFRVARNADPIETLMSASFHFLPLFLGNPAAEISRTLAWWIGIACLLLTAIHLRGVLLHVDARDQIGSLTLRSVVLFQVGQALLANLGRAATESGGIPRYRTPSLILWMALLALAIRSKSPLTRRIGLLAGTLAVVLLAFGQSRTARELAGTYNVKAMAGAALRSRVPDPESLQRIRPRWEMTFNLSAALLRHGLAPFNDDLVHRVGARLRDVGTVSGDNGPVHGHLGLVEAVPNGPYWRANGWAWDQVRQAPPPHIVLVDSREIIRGLGGPVRTRPDVAVPFPASHDQRVGWVAYARHPAGQLRAYAFDPRSRTFYPLRGVFLLPTADSEVDSR